MIPPDKLKEILSPFTKTKEADKTALTFFSQRLQVSRFANSQLHQHMSTEAQLIYFRLLCNGRLGVASTNSLDPAHLKEAFKKALHSARLKVKNAVKRDLVSFSPIPPVLGVNFPDTINATAAARAEILRKIFSYGQNKQIRFSGNLYNGLSQTAVIYPQGKMNYQDYSLCGIKTIAVSAGSSGYAMDTAYDLKELAVSRTAESAAEKCLLGIKKISLPPGAYDVILEPPATGEILAWLNYIGFGAKSFLEETGFLYNKKGRRVTGEKIGLYDDGRDKNTFILPFDFEGSPRRKALLIKNGIAASPVTDSYYAKLLKIKNTGHANFPDDTEGPLAYNLIMRNGKLPQDKIISSAKRALLINRFHYINGFLDTHKAQMTGMTRDGTLLIEDGRVKCGVKDMRFTENILEAFSRIKYISKERQLLAEPLDSFGSIYAPALYIKDFNFIS